MPKNHPTLFPLLRLALALTLLLAYPLAQALPLPAGWENGVLENTQALLLLAGGFASLYFARQSGQSQQRWFWRMIVPLWLVLILRELGWGTVFLEPIYMREFEGPQYFSSQQLSPGIKNAVVGLAAVALGWSILAFVRGQQWQTLTQLWHMRQLPLVELGLAAAAALYSTMAEGRPPLLTSLQPAALQMLEEITELLAYSALLLAQWRVRRALKPAGTADAAAAPAPSNLQRQPSTDGGKPALRSASTSSTPANNTNP